MRYYNRDNTVACPDCRQPADADFGSHGGDCINPLITLHGLNRAARTGPQIIKAWATGHEFLSINAIRDQMVREGVPETKRGPAFTAACQRGWIEHSGFEPSTDAGTKRHSVKVYRSLICPASRETAATTR